MRKKFVRDYNYKRKDGENQFSYVGDYYIFRMEETEKRKRSVSQVVFALAQLFLMVVAGLLNSPGSYKVYIVLPYLCMILPLIYYIMGAVGFARIPEKMEKHQYEVTLFRMVKSVLATFFLCIFTVGADGIFLMKNKDEIEVTPEVMFFGIMIVLAIMNYTALMYHNRIQKRVVVEKQKKEDTK